MIKYLCFAALTATSLSAWGQATTLDCQAFESSIEQSSKQAALLMASGAADNSAARETNRNLEISHKLQVINLNLQLQIANKCPVRKTPINPDVYYGQALICTLDRMKGEKSPASCELGNWKAENK
jgi:hypothetical protein